MKQIVIIIVMVHEEGLCPAASALSTCKKLNALLAILVYSKQIDFPNYISQNQGENRGFK